MAYKAAVFDMDGTILDTLADMQDSINVTMRKFGFPERTMDEVRSFVGNGAQVLIRRSLPDDTPDAVFEEAFLFYRDYYNEHASIKTGPYAGIPEALMQLKKAGVGLAVVSNKPDISVGRLAEYYFPGVFATAIGNRPDMKTKPAPDTVYEALHILGVGPADAVYIGDSDVDIRTAENAGMDCISVTWGFRDRAFLEKNGAVSFADTVREMTDMILNR